MVESAIQLARQVTTSEMPNIRYDVANFQVNLFVFVVFGGLTTVRRFTFDKPNCGGVYGRSAPSVRAFEDLE